MFFYIFFILFITSILGLSCIYPNKEKWFQWGVFVILVCVAGFRIHVGIDYDSYVDWYVNKTRDQDFEIGFLVLIKAFRAMHLSYHAFFFFFSFVTILVAFLGVKKYTANISLAVLFFFLIPELYLGSFNLIRQSFSICISFYAFYFLINKKYFIFSFLMLLAISIHISTILPLLVFVLVYKYADQINAKHIAFMLFFSLVLSQLNVLPFFEILFKNTRYSYYFDSPRTYVSILKTIVLNGVAFFVLFHFDRMKEKYILQKYLMQLYFCSVIFMNLFTTFSNIERLTYFFKIFEIIVVADLIYLVVKERRLLVLSFFYIYYLSAFIHTLNNNIEVKSSSKLVPYQTFILEKQ